MILLPCGESPQEAESSGQSRQEAFYHTQKFFFAGSKRLQPVSAGAKYDRQSWQEMKTGGLVYILWLIDVLFINSLHLCAMTDRSIKCVIKCHICFSCVLLLYVFVEDIGGHKRCPTS